MLHTLVACIFDFRFMYRFQQRAKMCRRCGYNIFCLYCMFTSKSVLKLCVTHIDNANNNYILYTGNYEIVQLFSKLWIYQHTFADNTCTPIRSITNQSQHHTSQLGETGWLVEGVCIVSEMSTSRLGVKQVCILDLSTSPTVINNSIVKPTHQPKANL